MCRIIIMSACKIDKRKKRLKIVRIIYFFPNEFGSNPPEPNPLRLLGSKEGVEKPLGSKVPMSVAGVLNPPPAKTEGNSHVTQTAINTTLRNYNILHVVIIF